MGNTVRCAYCGVFQGKDTRAGDALGNLFLFPCNKCMNISLIESTPEKIVSERIESAEDICEKFTEGSVPSVVLHRVRRVAESLPAMPEICQKVITLAHDPLSSMADIANEIKDDPALATRVLKLSNSVAYGGRSEIVNLDNACARLGLKIVVHMVQSLAHFDLYSGASHLNQHLTQTLWRHSVATAQAVLALTTPRIPARSDEMFIAGLVHDLGALVLSNIIVTSPTAKSSRLYQDPDFGAEFIKEWHCLAGTHAVDQRGMTDLFQFTTYFHSAPENAPNPTIRMMSIIINLAERLTVNWECGYDGDQTPVTEEDPFAREINLTNAEIEKINETVEPEIDALLAVMG